jgi:hypothetical protein
MSRSILMMCVVLIVAPSAALAQQRPLPLPFPPLIDTQGTPEERAACYGDVQRYCRNAGSDTFAILGCLQSNRQRISPACRGVLQSHGQ